MDLTAQFEAAVAASKNLPSKPSNENLLKLYSLFKQATTGDAVDEGPINPFDFVGKAKHEAWTALKGKTSEEAMTTYTVLVKSLENGS